MDKFQEVENILNELNPKPQQKKKINVRTVVALLKTYRMIVTLYVQTVE
jgi:hypothetical protein